jgi:hypothetical protein
MANVAANGVKVSAAYTIVSGCTDRPSRRRRMTVAATGITTRAA